jgi:putative transposase
MCVESLRVKAMMQHLTLAQAIQEVGWGELVRQLPYKAAWYRRTLVAIDRWYPSSKRCSPPECGHVLASLSLETRQWTCPACGALHDRDVNATQTVLAAGLAVSAWGEVVRPGRAKPDATRFGEAGIPRL